MSCCGGGCCWWKKQPDPPPPSTHLPPPPIHPPYHSTSHPSNPSTHPPNPPPLIRSPGDPSIPLIHPTPDPSNPSIHHRDPPSTSKKPRPTLEQVRSSFKKVDITSQADAFIDVLKQQLEGATAQKDAENTPSTSSSSKDKLSNWASCIESGATFLKFANDHIEKIHTKGDNIQLGEATQIVGNMLQQVGQLHWAVAGLSIVGYLVSKCHKVSENQTGYVDLLKDMLNLASHVKNLKKHFLEEKKKEKLENASQYIIEGSIYCASQLESGKIFSFLKSSINSDTLSSIRSNINKIYQDLQLTAVVEVLERQAVVLPLSQPGYPKNAVGIEEQLATVMNLLKMEKSEDCSSIAVVIWGFGGIGKTTLAQAAAASMVDRESYNYARIELDEVSEKNKYTLMQQRILKNGFPTFNGGIPIELQDDADGRNKLTEAFRSEPHKPVFLFIDNALHEKDLEKILPEDLSGLPQRSRILITTRILTVTDMLEKRGLQRKDYHVRTLSHNHAVEILCKDPAIRDGIKDDLEKLVNVCSGIPLVLEIVAARLRKQKYNADHCTQIVRALQRGEKIKEKELSKRLFEYVYNELESSTQEAFLDICCFFDKGFPCQSAKYIVGAEQVTSLQEAALITIVMGKPLDLRRPYILPFHFCTLLLWF